MFLLTGSQQWQVMQTLAESLAGRVAFLDLQGFSIQELAARDARAGWLGRWMDDADGLLASRPPSATWLDARCGMAVARGHASAGALDAESGS